MITPEAPSSPQIIGINYFNCARVNVHEDLLRKTAEQLAVKLTEDLQSYRGYSEANRLRRPIPSSMHTRARVVQTPYKLKASNVDAGPDVSRSVRQTSTVDTSSRFLSSDRGGVLDCKGKKVHRPNTSPMRLCLRRNSVE